MATNDPFNPSSVICGDNCHGGKLELLECVVFATDAVGTMIPTQPRVSIHRISNMAMHLSRKE